LLVACLLAGLFVATRAGQGAQHRSDTGWCAGSPNA
jgi:hypothetical protein